MRRSKNYFLVAVITLCILLTLCVIPAMAAEGEENKEISYATSYDTNVTVTTDNYVTVLPEVDTDKNEDTDEYWSGVTTDTPSVDTGEIDPPANEITLTIEDLIIKDVTSIHTLPVHCSRSSAATFYIELHMPYFVEVEKIVWNEELISTQNAVWEERIDGNLVYVAYSSAESFENCDLFYIEFSIPDASVIKSEGWIEAWDMQFVNSDSKEVYVNTNFGTITVDIDIDVLMGDANQDNVVNLEDVMFILRYQVHDIEFSDYGFYAADIDCNGSVDMVDCQYIQNYLVGKISSLDDIGNNGEFVCNHETKIPIYEKEATCSSEGYIIYQCACGKYEDTMYLEPTGEHSYIGRSCQYCGIEVEIVNEAHKTYLDILDKISNMTTYRMSMTQRSPEGIVESLKYTAADNGQYLLMNESGLQMEFWIVDEIKYFNDGSLPQGTACIASTDFEVKKVLSYLEPVASMRDSISMLEIEPSAFKNSDLIYMDNGMSRFGVNIEYEDGYFVDYGFQFNENVIRIDIKDSEAHQLTINFSNIDAELLVQIPSLA